MTESVLDSSLLPEQVDFIHFNDMDINDIDWYNKEYDQLLSPGEPFGSYAESLPAHSPTNNEQYPLDHMDLPPPCMEDMKWASANVEEMSFSQPLDTCNLDPLDNKSVELSNIKHKYDDEKKRHQTPKAAGQAISRWLLQNRMNPYPSTEQKMLWCKAFDMPMCQVNTFLTNKRVRLLGKKSARQFPLLVLQAYGIKPKYIGRRVWK